MIVGQVVFFLVENAKGVFSKLEPSTYWYLYFVLNYSCHVITLCITHGRHAWFISEKKKLKQTVDPVVTLCKVQESLKLACKC